MRSTVMSENGLVGKDESHLEQRYLEIGAFAPASECP